MDRLDFDQDMIRGLAEADYNAALTEDLDWPEAYRRTRVALEDTTTPVIKNSNLKRYDDIKMRNWVSGRVIGPARMDECFLCYVAPSADDPTQLHGVLTLTQDSISDRAPYNENEPPMPVSTRPAWD